MPRAATSSAARSSAVTGSGSACFGETVQVVDHRVEVLGGRRRFTRVALAPHRPQVGQEYPPLGALELELLVTAEQVRPPGGLARLVLPRVASVEQPLGLLGRPGASLVCLLLGHGRTPWGAWRGCASRRPPCGRPPPRSARCARGVDEQAGGGRLVDPAGGNQFRGAARRPVQPGVPVALRGSPRGRRGPGRAAPRTCSTRAARLRVRVPAAEPGAAPQRARPARGWIGIAESTGV